MQIHKYFLLFCWAAIVVEAVDVTVKFVEEAS